MITLQPVDEILASWRRCLNIGVDNTSGIAGDTINKEALQAVQEENSVLVSVFNNLGSDFEELSLKNNLVLLLVNNYGIILKKKCCRNLARRLEKKGIKEGISFSEKTIGTNAVSLSMKLKQAVYTIPQHHYSELLKEMFLYAIPLNYNCEDFGFLVLCRLYQEIEIDLKILGDLAAYKLVNDLKTEKQKSLLSDSKNYILTQKQLQILKMMAKGLPDKIIAFNQGISINTVKYHKKFIFKKLNVECTAQALIKCIKLNLLCLEEIDC